LHSHYARWHSPGDFLQNLCQTWVEFSKHHSGVGNSTIVAHCPGCGGGSPWPRHAPGSAVAPCDISTPSWFNNTVMAQCHFASARYRESLSFSAPWQDLDSLSSLFPHFLSPAWMREFVFFLLPESVKLLLLRQSLLIIRSRISYTLPHHSLPWRKSPPLHGFRSYYILSGWLVFFLIFGIITFAITGTAFHLSSNGRTPVVVQ